MEVIAFAFHRQSRGDSSEFTEPAICTENNNLSTHLRSGKVADLESLMIKSAYAISHLLLTPLAHPARKGATAVSLLAFVLILMMEATPLSAAVTWTGTIDGNWNNGGNWDTTAIPPPDSDIVFPADAVTLRPNTVNNLGPYSLNSITIVGAYTITSSTKLTTPTINASATATLAAPLGIPPAGLITIIQQTGTATLTLSGIISGTGGVTVAGPGVIQFTGSQANTYTGLTSVATTGTGYLRLARTGVESIPADLTVVASGKVVVDAASSQINYSSLVTVNGTLDISLASGHDSGSDTETIGALTGTGLVQLGSRRLGCYLSPTNPTYSGVLVGTAASSFRKHGLFTQKLSGSSPNLFGTTVVNGSALTVLGIQPSSNITANDGTVLLAKLASVGSVSMTGTSNLSIGNEPGVENQSTSKSLSLASTTRLDVFTGSTAGNSRLSVVGSVVLNGAALTVNTDVAPPAPATTIVIIDNDGTADPVSGAFASLPEGAEITSSGATPITFTISYVGGDGNDVTLTSLSGAPTVNRPAISSASTATGTVGSAFTYAITASNTPTSYAASNLPAGLSVNTSSGVISGTPTVAGAKSVLISASNASGTGSGTVTVTISGTGPDPAGGTPLPPGPATTTTSSSHSGCGSGGAMAVLSLMLMLGLTLIADQRRRR
jgi:hypothetical protein